MKDGVYLLVLPGADYGVPYTLKNNNGTVLLAGVDGVKILQNLEPGYKLIPMVAMTQERIDALDRLFNGDQDTSTQTWAVLSRLLDEVLP